jgi:hypothetical protein
MVLKILKTSSQGYKEKLSVAELASTIQRNDVIILSFAFSVETFYGVSSLNHPTPNA